MLLDAGAHHQAVAVGESSTVVWELSELEFPIFDFFFFFFLRNINKYQGVKDTCK